MANEELILTDDLNKLLVELDKNSKSLSSSTKKLSSDSKELTKSFSSLSKEVRDVFKGMATDNLDKVIKKLEETKKYYDLLQESFKGEKGLESDIAQASKYTQVLSELIPKLKEINKPKTPNSPSNVFEPLIARAKEELEVYREFQKEYNKKGVFFGGEGIDLEVKKAEKKLEILKKAEDSLKNREHSTIFNQEEATNELKELGNYYRNIEQEQQKSINKLKSLSKERERVMQDERKMREEEYKSYYESYDGSLRFSDNAKSINDRVKAIENMRKAYKNLDPSVEGNREKMARLNLEIKKQESALRRLQGETAKTSNAMGQWASRLGALFGINAISNFVRKMVTVRGEFELQQKSLEVLLKSKSEANKLWEQTVQLAVKSPFQVEQLITYTKQLAAYQIETDKLHDTTKRLADLSAGLGVDMDRLILAYGQVRTAEYLRATEVRQFTEAGVPLIDALADRFSALEGKAMSVAEVMERITKRQVTFGDVEAVINQMTDLGGLFYNMQEEQSKTVKGMMSNLKDEISLMFNEIGESSEGTIKRSLQVVRWLVQHWEVFGGILAAIVPLYGIHKLGQLRFNENLMALAETYEVAGTKGRKYLKVSQLIELTTKRLKKAFDSLKIALMKNPITAIVALVVGGIANAIFSIKNFNDTLNEITDNTITKIDELNNKKIDIIDTKDLDEKREKLAELVNIAKTYQIEIDFKINELSSSQINEKANEISNQIKGSLQAIEAFDKAVAEQEYETGGGWIGLGMFEEEMHEDVQDLRDDLLDLNTQIGKLPASAKTTGMLFSKSFSDIVEQSGSAEEAIIKMRSEVINLHQAGKINFIDRSAMLSDIDALESSIEEFKREADEIFDNLNEDGFENLTNEEKVRRLNLAINARADWNEFEKDLAKAEAEKKYGIKLRLTLEESAQKTLQDDLDTLYTSMAYATSVNVDGVKKEFDATLKKIKERTESLFNLRKDSITEMINLEKKAGNGTLTKEEQKKLDLLRKTNSEYIRQKQALDLLKDYRGDGFMEFISDVKDGLLTNNNLLNKFYNTLSKINGLQPPPEIGSYYSILKKDIDTIAKDLGIQDNDWIFGNKPIGNLSTEIQELLDNGSSYEEAILNLYNKYEEEKKKSSKMYNFLRENQPEDYDKKWEEALHDASKDYNEDANIFAILTELAKQYKIETQKGSGSGGKAESIVPKQIEEMKKAFEEWDKLNDYRDNTVSATNVVDAMTESLGALNVQLGKQDGFLTFNGQIVRTKRELADLFGSMADKAKDENDKRLFLQAQASIQVEFDQDEAKREFEEVIKKIDDQIAGYEIFSGLKDLNIGIDIGELADIFNVGTKSLEDIKKGLEDQLGALPAGNEEEHKKIVEKINQVEEMQDKERVERLKEYTKMLEKTMDDNLKVHYDYYKQLGQIEQDRRKGVITENFANALKTQLDQQYKGQKDKVAWEDFTGSDDYIRLFEDMDNVSTKALKDMRERLLGLRESLKNLPPDQLKEIVKAIDDLDDKINERNPFKSFAVWGDAFSGSIKKSKQEIEKLKNGLNNITIDFNGEKREYKGVNLTDIKKETKIYEEEIGKLEGLSRASIPIDEERLSWLRESLAINKLIAIEIEKQIQKKEEDNTNAKEQWQQNMQTLSELGGGIESLSGNLGSMLEQFGASDAIVDTVSSIGEIGGAIGGMAGGIAGVIANPGDIGAWVQAIGGLMDTITAIGGASDKSKQREIENLQEHIDGLAKSYEELTEAMDTAYSMDKMSNAYRMAQANIESQKKAIKEQIELEKEKWNTDEDKVKEYEEQLEELDEQSEDLKQQLIDSMGGITDTSSKAREFVDAWVDAFKETGDGLSGLEENFDEFFDNLIREQISKQVGSITQKFADEVNKAITEGGDAGEITEEEWRHLQRQANLSKEQMNNLMQMYRQFFEESGAGLSGLQEGIKGITESQADIIASYLNSIRMFVSEKTSYAREIRNILMGINGQPNPMLDELRRVARHTENIRDLLLRVSDPISNTLKVSIYQ